MTSSDTKTPSYVRFAIAGLSGTGGVIVTHPIDVIKYRMQLNGKNGKQKIHKTSLHAIFNIAKKEGLLSIYSGLSAGIFRQLTLTMVRLGLYTTVIDTLTAAHGTPPNLLTQTIAGAATGVLGALVGNPSDVALVRMASDGSNPPKERYNYKHCFDAINRIRKEEGPHTLWTAIKPSCFRTILLNFLQVILYRNSKAFLTNKGYVKDNSKLPLITSSWVALVTSIATCPIDLTKTRLMNMKKRPGTKEYTGMIDVWIKVIKDEGLAALWKGFLPTFARILPNNLIFFFLLEFLTLNYKKMVLGDKSATGF